MTRAGQIIAGGARSNDACLHARQYLERALGASPETVFTLADYSFAARRADAAGRVVHGETLEALGAVDPELAATRPLWDGRYQHREITAAEQVAATLISSGQVVERGRAGQGIDGAWYARAYYPRTGRPAVVVTTSAMTQEVVTFGSAQTAGAWLATRAPSSRGPLPTTAGGPVTRVAREEEILSWLVRHPADATALTQRLGQHAWTTHLRAELFGALRWLTRDGRGKPDLEVIAGTYQRRLLRAPGWAAGEIGWPDATRALAYLERLTATPVTRDRAVAAARALATADTAAATSPGNPRPAAIPQAQRPASVRAPVVPPPHPQPGPSGPVPRM